MNKRAKKIILGVALATLTTGLAQANDNSWAMFGGMSQNDSKSGFIEVHKHIHDINTREVYLNIYVNKYEYAIEHTNRIKAVDGFTYDVGVGAVGFEDSKQKEHNRAYITISADKYIQIEDSLLIVEVGGRVANDYNQVHGSVYKQLDKKTAIGSIVSSTKAYDKTETSLQIGYVVTF